ncbi:MAG: ATP-grasp domain-containing protein [Pseudomonadota bacterium]
MLLILDNYKQSLPVIKSLSLRNIPFILGSSVFLDPICSSKYCKEVWRHPDLENPQHFFTALDALLKQRKEIDAIFPIGELALNFLAENYLHFSQRAKLIMPSSDNVLLCLNKSHCIDFVAKLAIPYANSHLIKNKSELKSIAEETGFPVIFKPNFTVDALVNKKAVIVHNVQQLSILDQQWDGAQPLLVERYIEGKRVSVNLVVQQGELISYLENQALYTQEMDGTGFTIRTISRKPTLILQKYASLLVKKLNYNGIINIQFMYSSAQQKYFFMEINPRMPATTAFLYKMGIDVAAYSLHLSDYYLYSEFSKQTNKKQGVLCNWFYGDVVAFSKNLFNGKFTAKGAMVTLGYIFKSVIASDIDQIWSKHDPKPTIYTFMRPFIVRLMGK